MRKKSDATDKKHRKYSWQPYIDKSLAIPCRVAANAKKMELREYLSEVLRKKLFGEQAETGKVT